MLLRPLAAAAFMSAAVAALPASAMELRLHPAAVIELFTSQGCSSCPPADAMLARMRERQDIVALSYHVDYWDYIGWPDSFGSAAWSDLQRDYAKGWGSARIYTPQLIVNGAQGVVASRASEVDAALKGSHLALPVNITSHDGILEVSVEAMAGLPNAIVWLVTFRDRSNVAIDRGENQGKTISYTQIVTGRQVVAMWEAATGAHLKLPLNEVLTGDANGAAIIVQQENGGLPGKILGAAAFQM